MPDISSPHETCDDTLERTSGQVAGECAAARLPAVFFCNPDADHGAGIVSHARRVLRLEPVARGRKTRPQPRQLRQVLYRVDLRTDIRQVGLVRAADHPFLSPACVSAGGADREETEEV